jgi:5-deoxy-glucuronate isomerase
MSYISPLLRGPKQGIAAYQKILASDAQWTHLNMEARLMTKGDVWEGETGDHEYAFILLSGNYKAETTKGTWETKNGRRSVFEGIAHTLYLPRHTSFTIIATSEQLDIAAGWCFAKNDFPARFKTPDEAAIEIRGGDNATRQINSLVEPGFGADHIVAVEVYTPAGNWSSYPAHKHDERMVDEKGNVLEACLEEFYFFKVDKPGGFAIQQVYTTDRSIDEVVKVHNNDVMLVPKGFHPVVAGHGFNCYYLNFLAGSDQSLANTPDPNHVWMFDSWSGKDPRIPMVTAAMNNK